MFVYSFGSWIVCFAEPIKTEVEPLHQRQKEGSKVEFKCLVQGNKKVFYQWVKDGTEMPGQNSSSLVLDCVEMRDFGYYVCNVNDANDDCIKSPAAVLDVAPRDGMGQCCLNCITCVMQKKKTVFLPSQSRGYHRSGLTCSGKKVLHCQRKVTEFSFESGKLTF